MMIQTRLPIKTEFYIFLAVVELSPEKAQLHYGTPFQQKADLLDSGVRAFLTTRATQLFDMSKAEAGALYDGYVASTEMPKLAEPEPLGETERTEPPQRTCNSCHSDKTYIDGKGYALWYKIEEGTGFLCIKCYNRARKMKESRKRNKTTSRKSCQSCGSTTTYVYNDYPRWHTMANGKDLLCHKCYSAKNNQRLRKGRNK